MILGEDKRERSRPRSDENLKTASTSLMAGTKPKGPIEGHRVPSSIDTRDQDNEGQ